VFLNNIRKGTLIFEIPSSDLTHVITYQASRFTAVAENLAATVTPGAPLPEEAAYIQGA
jgi:hypothetical protein